MTIEAKELINRTEKLIFNPTTKRNPYYKNRLSWVTANIEMNKYIKKTERNKEQK